MSPSNNVPQDILQQAVEWLLRQQAASLTESEQQEFQHWLQQSEQHQRAWQCAEHLTHTLNELPKQHSSDILKQADQIHSRHIIGKLVLLFTVALSTYFTWQSSLRHQLMAEFVTKAGQQKQIKLSDGSEVHLNTHTALDSHFDQQQRLLKLYYGEIHIRTAKDSHVVKRPFRVQTEHGVLEALGTVFNVQQIDDQTCVAVLESAVKVSPYKLAPVVVEADQQLCFNQHTYQPVQQININTQTWHKGLFLAYDMPLSEFVREMQRYHRGYISIHDDIADVRISGSYPINDTSKVLEILTQTYPVSVDSRFDGYWVSLEQKQP